MVPWPHVAEKLGRVTESADSAYLPFLSSLLPPSNSPNPLRPHSAASLEEHEDIARTAATGSEASVSYNAASNSPPTLKANPVCWAKRTADGDFGV